jgi:outer membrane lipoprotein-sorting protein
MRSLITSSLALAAALAFANSDSAYADSAEARGAAIAQAADQADQGWRDATVTVQMTLVSARDERSNRQLRYRLLEHTQGDKVLIVFDDPADVKGTALLTHTHAVGDDDQWLYLPALKRVKRIAANNKAGPFVGSEFAYEDLAAQEVVKYRYRYLRDEVIAGNDCHVIERIPVDPDSGYARQEVWIDKAHHRQWKVSYFDRKNAPLKILIASDFKQYLNKHWRPAVLEMRNTRTGKSTRLVFSDYSFGNGLSERDFDRNSLQDVR